MTRGEEDRRLRNGLSVVCDLYGEQQASWSQPLQIPTVTELTHIDA